MLLVDERGGVRRPRATSVLAPARAIGIYEGGLVPVDAGTVLYRVRAGRIVVATGSLEQPLVFPGNDLVGVMLPGAVRRLVDDWAVKPGERAVVIAADARGLADHRRRSSAPASRSRPSAIFARAEPPRIAARRARRQARPPSTVGAAGQVACDLLVVSGGRQPAYSLLAQAGARVEYEPRRGIFVPTSLPPGIEAVGSVTGPDEPAAVPSPSYAAGQGRPLLRLPLRGRDREGREARGRRGLRLDRAREALHDRDDGALPGQALPRPVDPPLARETRDGEEAIGTTTARPPWEPVELGLLAGRHHEPMKRSPLHHRHEQAGATMMWTGAWRRPFDYGDVEAEVRAVHEDLGVIDVSTLGKLLVEGPDAGALLDRLYPNRFSDLAAGRIRYGVLTTDGGRIMDDGTVARLADDLFYVTTTSTGSDAVSEWFEWWNAVWDYDVEIVNVTGGLAAINLAGPRAREALASLTGDDVSNEALRYLDARELTVAGVPCLALRIGFVGELGYELHCPRARPSTCGTRCSRPARCRSGSRRSGCSGSRRRT